MERNPSGPDNHNHTAAALTGRNHPSRISSGGGWSGMKIWQDKRVNMMQALMFGAVDSTHIGLQ